MTKIKTKVATKKNAKNTTKKNTIVYDLDDYTPDYTGSDLMNFSKDKLLNIINTTDKYMILRKDAPTTETAKLVFLMIKILSKSK